ncbi:WXG100 family type VII secretion target [Streptomyces sp. NPDC001139]
MAPNPYPNIGWNPVPGVPVEVTKLRQKVAAAATALENTHRQLTRLTGESSYWEGDAADAFRDSLDGDLQRYIKDAASSLRNAATELHKWDGHLTAHRELAKKYDADAADKKAAVSKAKASYDQAARQPDLKLAGQTFPSQEEADAATARLRSAEHEMREASAALTKANEEYASLDAKVKELETEHIASAEAIARALEGSAKKAPEEPGFWNEVGDVLNSVGDFLLENAGTIGAIAGLLALFPTPLAPLFAGIAIAASAADFAKNFADPDFRDAFLPWGDKFGWNVDTVSAWASFGGDFVGMVPGARALSSAARGIRAGLTDAAEMGVGVTSREVGTEFVREVGHVLSTAPRAAVGEAWQAAGESVGGSAKLMTDISVNGLGVVANFMPEDGAPGRAATGINAGGGVWAGQDVVRTLLAAR